MGYSIFKHGSPLLTNIQDLEQAKKEALHFVTSVKSEWLEIRDSDNGTVTIGYFYGSRFHWEQGQGTNRSMEVQFAVVVLNQKKGGVLKWESILEGKAGTLISTMKASGTPRRWARSVRSVAEEKLNIEGQR